MDILYATSTNFKGPVIYVSNDAAFQVKRIHSTIWDNLPLFMLRILDPLNIYPKTTKNFQSLVNYSVWDTKSVTHAAALEACAAREPDDPINIICDSCPLNCCVHFFPKARRGMDIPPELTKCAPCSLLDIPVYVAKHPNFPKSITFVRTQNVQPDVTKYLHEHHSSYFILAGLHDNICNSQVDRVIDELKPGWSIDGGRSMPVTASTDMIICELCNSEKSHMMCVHLLPAYSNSSLCARAFREPAAPVAIPVTPSNAHPSPFRSDTPSNAHPNPVRSDTPSDDECDSDNDDDTCQCGAIIADLVSDQTFMRVFKALNPYIVRYAFNDDNVTINRWAYKCSDDLVTEQRIRQTLLGGVGVVAYLCDRLGANAVARSGNLIEFMNDAQIEILRGHLKKF
jgi:hypothetical protein